MSKKLVVALATIPIFLNINKATLADSGFLSVAESSAVLKNEALGLPKPDARITQLDRFLTKFNSPLKPYADVFVNKADQFGLDWKLVPAIAGVESTFGKNIPNGSFNAYGWNNGAFYFQSWEESIEVVSKALSEKYLARGLDTPYKIGPVYAPPSKTWAGNVVYFMNQIESFGSDFSLTL